MSFKNNLSYIFIILLLPFIFLLLFGRFGLEDSDSGFIVGMGWRIINGELPYKDFYYVRPALSPLISALWLSIIPDYGEVISMRLINYIQLMLQVILTIKILEKFYDFKSLNLNPYLFTILSFLITSIGTLYFQWHTTDGIFLAVVGFFLITHFSNKGFLVFILAGLFFTASALTKQNFLIVVILGLIFVLLQYGLLKALQLGAGIILGILSFYLYLLELDILAPYLLQNKGATTLKDLVVAGFVMYFNFGSVKALSALFLTSLTAFLFIKFVLKKNTLESIIISLIFSIISINSLAYLYLNGSKLIWFDRFIPVVIVSTFLYLFIKRKENIKNHYILIALLGIAWGSSISWGGMSPIMYFTPIFFGVYYLLHKNQLLSSKKVNIFLIILITFYSFISNTKPYRDDFVWTKHYDGDKISDKLAFVEVDDIEMRKHLELKKIFQKYEKTTVLPSMPGAYYLHNRKNYFAIDWAMDVEAAYDRKGLIDELENCCNYYIVEKKAFGQPIGTQGKFYSSITDYVLSRYHLYDSSYEYFDIYTKK